MKDIGVTDCGISNNHIFDYGYPGVNETIEAITSNGMTVTGFGKDYEAIMSAFDSQSQILKCGEWRQHWSRFCQDTKERYAGNISRAYTENADPADNEIFNGRMHCEAHKDVIDELYKHSWEERTEP